MQSSNNHLNTLTTITLSKVDNATVAVHNLNKIKPKDIQGAIDSLLAEYDAVLAAVTAESTPASWQHVEEELDKISAKFSATWAAINHLTNVNDSQELRNEYDAILPKVTAFFARMSQNKALYLKTKRSLTEDTTLNATQQYILQEALLGFKLSGVELDSAKQAKFQELKMALSKTSNDFGNNVLDATNAFSKHITDLEELRGLPEFVISAAKQKATEKELSGYVLGIDPPTYMAVITYASNRKLREEFYHAYVTRASELGTNQALDNTNNMVEMLQIKQQLAALVGFKNYAEYSLATKMAPSVDNVIKFLRDILKQAKPFANKEFQTLQEFAHQVDNIDKLAAFDLAYYSNLYQKQIFDISQEDLRPYFQEEQVMKQMLKLASELFKVQFVDVTKDFAKVLYHDSVKVYAVLDNNTLQGFFVTDLYARATKRGGAWMAEWFSRLKINDNVQIPSAFLNCNFAFRATGGLLTHDDVVTLFHEFGHTLHGILTKVDYLGASGMSNVPWDGVELPSQFFENFAWRYEVIKNISSHYQTKEVLPEAMFQKLLKTKNYNAGLFLVRQIEFGLFDMLLHQETNITANKIATILHNVRQETNVLMPPEYNRFAHSFSHIFNGGYSAGYYSYLWADVLSSDAFELFASNSNIINQEIGLKFKQEILAVGGSRDFMASYQAFSGRKPEIKYLLKNYGLL